MLGVGWQLVAAAPAGAHGFFDAGVGRFLVSPGFGGLAALVGGALAYAAARQKTRQEAEATRQRRWLETLTWIYDRATAERPEARLAPPLALEMFVRLYEESHTDLEVQMVDGLLGVFQDAPGATSTTDSTSTTRTTRTTQTTETTETT